MENLNTITKVGLMTYIAYCFHHGITTETKSAKTIRVFTEIILIIFAFTLMTADHFELNVSYIVLALFYLPVMFLLADSGQVDIAEIIRSPYRIIVFINNNMTIFWITLVSTLKEELIWRIIFVYTMELLAIPTWGVILSGSLLFTVLHRKSNKPIPLRAQFELFLFSIILYSLYLYSMSLIAVWSFHFIRNITIKAYHDIK